MNQRLASQYGILGSARSSHSTMRASFSASDVPLNSPHGPKERRFSTNKEPTDSELSSSVHRQFRNAHEGHKPHAGLDPSRASTGVVWTTERAYEHGFAEHPEKWANLGQGAPEVDDEIEGCFERPHTIDVSMSGREYGPTAGIKPLREAVANLYNEHHRKGKESQYTWENVCIVPGGRAGLIRIAAVIGNAYLGFFIPDYTAYNEMLSLFKNFSAIPIPLSKQDGYHMHPDKIAEEIARGTSVILTSNPRNPTGQVLTNPQLAQIQDICRDRATLVMDEFYSGYNYTTDCDGTVISAADNIEDVDEDDVLIIDGLTKRFRLPGWRVAWIIGPKEFIKAIGSCGSYLDGGTNVPFQEAAIPMLEPTKVKHEMRALQHHFREKRDYVIDRLTEMGFKIPLIPNSTFYLWLDLSSLPEGINDGLNFFNACLKEKVIVVPGIFFDLNPSKRRDLFDSPCHKHVRLSYGPRMDVLKMGLDGIERVVKKHRNDPTPAKQEGPSETVHEGHGEHP
ncbi:aminotransferase [Aureobasidium pullulans]|nr:aminotransferase [Aureobasidium pullulans]THZ56625.1 aminotransferase [Aureobasidium pullulans]